MKILGAVVRRDEVYRSLLAAIKANVGSGLMPCVFFAA